MKTNREQPEIIVQLFRPTVLDNFIALQLIFKSATVVEYYTIASTIVIIYVIMIVVSFDFYIINTY